MVATLTSTDLDRDHCPKCGAKINALQKRPVAFRVGPFAYGWAVYEDEALANRHAESYWDHAVSVQGLYVRDGT